MRRPTKILRITENVARIILVQRNFARIIHEDFCALFLMREEITKIRLIQQPCLLVPYRTQVTLKIFLTVQNKQKTL